MPAGCSDTALGGAGHSTPRVSGPLARHPAKCTGWGGGAGTVASSVSEEPAVCCFSVLPLVEVVAPPTPTFQPIAMHLLPPHPLPLVHPPVGAASGHLPLLVLHRSVRTARICAAWQVRLLGAV